MKDFVVTGNVTGNASLSCSYTYRIFEYSRQNSQDHFYIKRCNKRVKPNCWAPQDLYQPHTEQERSRHKWRHKCLSVSVNSPISCSLSLFRTERDRDKNQHPFSAQPSAKTTGHLLNVNENDHCIISGRWGCQFVDVPLQLEKALTRPEDWKTANSTQPQSKDTLC